MACVACASNVATCDETSALTWSVVSLGAVRGSRNSHPAGDAVSPDLYSLMVLAKLWPRASQTSTATLLATCAFVAPSSTLFQPHAMRLREFSAGKSAFSTLFHSQRGRNRQHELTAVPSSSPSQRRWIKFGQGSVQDCHCHLRR